MQRQTHLLLLPSLLFLSVLHRQVVSGPTGDSKLQMNRQLVLGRKLQPPLSSLEGDMVEHFFCTMWPVFT
ncbi:hypothetical protein XELAEV_18020563mg [Xenopus laevis]|uniref:Uncharacterized protein n=1 Tax=Xenopus laevis TaxID=8355 RepID=A0A974D731_XENLA|nr:hypothetical protein XELAEV_18020563mg [Xenopus laevis]